MPQYSFSCDVKQGFEFEQDKTTMCGFLMKLKIANTDVTGAKKTFDLPRNPLDPANKLTGVVGVLSSVSWNGGATDPISFSFDVTNDALADLATLVGKSLPNRDVIFKWHVVRYDSSTLKYYKAFHNNEEEWTGQIELVGKDLQLFISRDMDTSQSRECYPVSITIKPKREEKVLHIAEYDGGAFCVPWGVKG